jgi:hypothetical protein
MRLGSIVMLESAPLVLVHETRPQIGRDVMLFAALGAVAVDGILGKSPDKLFRLPSVKLSSSKPRLRCLQSLLSGLCDVAVDPLNSKPRRRCVHAPSVFDVTVCVSRELILQLSSSGHLSAVLLLAGLRDIAVDSPQGVLSESPRGVPGLSGVHWLSVVGVTVGHGGGRMVMLCRCVKGCCMYRSRRGGNVEFGASCVDGVGEEEFRRGERGVL